jgi:hypothetical protein
MVKTSVNLRLNETRRPRKTSITTYLDAQCPESAKPERHGWPDIPGSGSQKFLDDLNSKARYKGRLMATWIIKADKPGGRQELSHIILGLVS